MSLSPDPYRPTHVWPGRDSFGHEPSASCPCGPRLKLFRFQGQAGWAMLHEPLDLAVYDVSVEPSPPKENPCE